MTFNCLRDNDVVVREGARHRFGALLPKPYTTFDVGEKEGERFFPRVECCAYPLFEPRDILPTRKRGGFYHQTRLRTEARLTYRYSSTVMPHSVETKSVVACFTGRTVHPNAHHSVVKEQTSGVLPLVRYGERIPYLSSKSNNLRLISPHVNVGVLRRFSDKGLFSITAKADS